MANDYYDSTGAPVTSSSVASSPIRNQYNLIEDGFDKMPTLVGNGGRAVVVKSDGSKLEVTTGSFALAGDWLVTGAFDTTIVAVADISLTLPSATATLATQALAETLSNKVLVNASGTNLSLNVGTAATLTTARSIYGSSFDGSAAIAGPITGAFGGTGVNNGSFTITIAGNLVTTGAFTTTLAATAAATHTLPAGAGTLLSTFAVVTVPQGGTGATSFTAYAVLCGGTTSTGAIQAVAGVGTAGYALTSNGAGALPTFQTVPSGLVLLNTLTASSSAALIDTTSLTSSYDVYMFELEDLIPASTATLVIAFSTDGGSTYTSTHGWQYLNVTSTTPTSATQAANQSTATLSSVTNVSSGGTVGLSGFYFFTNPNSGNQKKLFGLNGHTTNQLNVHYIFASTTSVINAVKVLFSGQNAASGKFRIWGVKTS